MQCWVLSLAKTVMPQPSHNLQRCFCLHAAVSSSDDDDDDDFFIIIVDVDFSPIQAFLTQLVCHLLDEGNSCYRDGDWQQATQQYSEGISVARYAQAEALVIPHELLECLYVNRAAAFYQAVSHSATRGGNVVFTSQFKA